MFRVVAAWAVVLSVPGRPLTTLESLLSYLAVPHGWVRGIEHWVDLRVFLVGGVAAVLLLYGLTACVGDGKDVDQWRGASTALLAAALLAQAGVPIVGSAVFFVGRVIVARSEHHRALVVESYIHAALAGAIPVLWLIGRPSKAEVRGSGDRI